MGKKTEYVWDKQGQRMVERAKAEAVVVDAPYVQGDEIPPTESHATDERKIFTSKCALEAHYAEHGFVCTGGSHLTGKSVGPHPKRFDCAAERLRKIEWGMFKADPNIRATVAEEARKVKWGMAPLTEREKETCNREERAYQQFLQRQKA